MDPTTDPTTNHVSYNSTNENTTSLTRTIPFQIASIFTQQYELNSNSTFTFEKHSTLYIYAEKSYTYLGLSRMWLETLRTTRGSKASSPHLVAIKRVRPIGKKTIFECFSSVDISGINVEIHEHEVYVETGKVLAFIVRCMNEFIDESARFDERKYGYANMHRFKPYTNKGGLMRRKACRNRLE